MLRLNQHAFDILKTEVERCTANNTAGQVQREIVFKRLRKLCAQEGNPIGLEELRETIADIFPTFNEKVLQAAAQANRPSTVFNQLKLAATVLVGAASLTGVVWVLNLPYPMIRWPVSRTIPIVLLPSFISMDSNYRQAIALTEQADQLVNQATSPADFELGDTKTKAAQRSLDALPVWFLGHYPQHYCSLFQCSWRFTLDEFQDARKSVGRMEAKLFQEKNAQTQLNQADQANASAKQQYQESPNPAERSAAIVQWQQAIDALREVPSETLAGRTAQTKLAAYERDFQQVSGRVIGTARTGTLIDAAKEFGKVAAQSAAGTAHTVIEWEEIQNQWNDAIARLEKIDDKDPDYIEAQKLLATYKKNFSTARIRLRVEQDAVRAYEEAQQLTQSLFASLPADAAAINRNYVISQLQEIVNWLTKVKRGTTVYPEAQNLLKSAQKKLAEVRK